MKREFPKNVRGAPILGVLTTRALPLWLQVYKEYLLWALKYINMTYFGLFGASGYYLGFIMVERPFGSINSESL